MTDISEMLNILVILFILSMFIILYVRNHVDSQNEKIDEKIRDDSNFSEKMKNVIQLEKKSRNIKHASRTNSANRISSSQMNLENYDEDSIRIREQIGEKNLNGSGFKNPNQVYSNSYVKIP